jgi:hypothetical protein
MAGESLREDFHENTFPKSALTAPFFSPLSGAAASAGTEIAQQIAAILTPSSKPWKTKPTHKSS